MQKELEKESTGAVAQGCCGGPAPAGVEACCVADADAKDSGDDGCGCGTASAGPTKKITSSCC